MSRQCVVPLLGKPDQPTDAVNEYCSYLSAALRARGLETELARVEWADQGWLAALRRLRLNSQEWKNQQVLIQYTALAWSSRGFPLGFLQVLDTVQNSGARVGVVFHDVEPYGGSRAVDRLRRLVQLRTMRRALIRSDLAIFTIALDRISWLGNAPTNACFIPIGANLPLDNSSSEAFAGKPSSLPCVVVFGITGGEPGKNECRLIAAAVRTAANRVGKLRLSVLGRGTSDFELPLREELRNAPVDLEVKGMLPAEQVVEELRSADAMLFVRGPISSRRGSAIAGISCGLPVVAYGGRETAAPITNAGVVLVPEGDHQKFSEALVQILTDQQYRSELSVLSRNAHALYFSWDAIAMKYLAALNDHRHI
jgi:glycosyltransferase involved in cell wall biosynthesis